MMLHRMYLEEEAEYKSQFQLDSQIEMTFFPVQKVQNMSFIVNSALKNCQSHGENKTAKVSSNIRTQKMRKRSMAISSHLNLEEKRTGYI